MWGYGFKISQVFREGRQQLRSDWSYVFKKLAIFKIPSIFKDMYIPFQLPIVYMNPDQSPEDELIPFPKIKISAATSSKLKLNKIPSLKDEAIRALQTQSTVDKNPDFRSPQTQTQEQDCPFPKKKPRMCMPAMKLNIISSLKQEAINYLQNKSNSLETVQPVENYQPPTALLQGNQQKKGPSFKTIYEMGKLLGQGASGTVHICIKKQTKQKYAVKTLKLDDEQVIFLRASHKNISQIDHPNIIKNYAVYLNLVQHQAHILMELFQHPSLDHYEFESEEELKDIAFKILEAVQYIHSIGIVHRDIKPENILYNRQTKQIKLVDFGVSRLFKAGMKKRKSLFTNTGTDEYKAPEILKLGGSYNEDIFYDELIDQWAVGCTLYRIVAGISPFYEPDQASLFNRITKATPLFNEPAWQKYSPSLKNFLKTLITFKDKRCKASEAKLDLWIGNNKINPSPQFMTSQRPMTSSRKIQFDPHASLSTCSQQSKAFISHLRVTKNKKPEAKSDDQFSHSSNDTTQLIKQSNEENKE